MKYPDEFLRGILNKNMVDDEGRATAGLFQFIENKEKKGKEYTELSINWKDDDGAETEILNKIKDGEYHFKIGYAQMCRTKLDMVLNSHTYQGRLTYERDPLKDNKYHGNILMIKNLDSPTRKLIYSSLAFCVENIFGR